MGFSGAVVLAMDGSGDRPRGRSSGRLVQTERLSDESAAMTAGAMASSTNDGRVHTTSGNDRRTGRRRAAASCWRCREALASCANDSSIGASGEPFRSALGDHVGQPDHRRAEVLRERGERVAERLATFEPMDNCGEPTTGRRRGEGRHLANRVHRGEPGVDEQDEEFDGVGRRPFDPLPGLALPCDASHAPRRRRRHRVRRAPGTARRARRPPSAHTAIDAQLAAWRRERSSSVLSHRLDRARRTGGSVPIVVTVVVIVR